MIEWLTRVFGREQPKTVAEVMSAYGEIIEKYPIEIMDISMLPAPKLK